MSPDELWLRVSFVAWASTLTSIGIFFRIRAQTDEALDRVKEGWLLLLGIRLSTLLAILLLFCWVFAPGMFSWAVMPLGIAIRWLGLGIAIASLLLKAWTFATLGRNLTDTVVTRRDHSLVRSGPYRFVRHPSYSSFALDNVGLSLVTAWWPIMVDGVVVLIMQIARTKREECFLIKAFGDEYQTYRREVGAFIPRPRHYRYGTRNLYRILACQLSQENATFPGVSAISRLALIVSIAAK